MFCFSIIVYDLESSDVSPILSVVAPLSGSMRMAMFGVKRGRIFTQSCVHNAESKYMKDAICLLLAGRQIVELICEGSDLAK